MICIRYINLRSWCSIARYGRLARQAKDLLRLLILHLDPGEGPLVFGTDETLERCRGPCIGARGIYRDAVRFSRTTWSRPVACAGFP